MSRLNLVKQQIVEVLKEKRKWHKMYTNKFGKDTGDRKWLKIFDDLIAELSIICLEVQADGEVQFPKYVFYRQTQFYHDVRRGFYEINNEPITEMQKNYMIHIMTIAQFETHMD